MVESYLQITCDGCGDTQSSDIPNMTREKFRKELRRFGWRNYGRFDYCGCAKSKRGYSMFDSTKGDKNAM